MASSRIPDDPARHRYGAFVVARFSISTPTIAINSAAGKKLSDQDTPDDGDDDPPHEEADQ